MYRLFRLLLMLSVTVAVTVGLTACGGDAGESGDPPTAGAASPAKPSSVVARIGGFVVTGAMFDHALAVEAKTEQVVPPRFEACVAQLRARSHTSAAGAATPSVAQLRSTCAQRYQVLNQEALNEFIVDDWVIGGAQELGVAVSGKEFERKFAAIRNRSFKTQAKYQSYLTKSGRTPADVRSLVRMELDSEAIRTALAQRVGPITPAKVRRYYEQHKGLYSVAETRDLEIAATGTRAEAMTVRRQVSSGRSFASIVKGLSGVQPLASSDGLVLGLASGYYREPALNQAIFTAKPGVLTGPIKTVIGYYVFKLKKIHPAFQKPLATVASSIRTLLPETLARQQLVDYIKQWRARWTAKTDCSAGYVIQKCRHFKSSLKAAEDPYTLD